MCKATDIKMIFYSHANETHFQKEGFSLILVLKVRSFWKSEMAYLSIIQILPRHCLPIWSTWQWFQRHKIVQ